VGQLYDAKLIIERVIAEKKLEPKLAMGQVGLKAGFLLAFVKADTPDDPAKLDKLRRAVKEVLGSAI
jgi:hypothetical protein